MAISGFGNTQNNLKLTLNSKAAKPSDVELKSKQLEQPKAQPSAVWVGDGHFGKDSRPGDVIIGSDGKSYRHVVDAEGVHYLTECSGPKVYDYEWDRGDIRRTD